MAWLRIYNRVVLNGTPLWGRVRGPISALIATLVQYGWHPGRLELWHDSQGHPVTVSLVPPGDLCRAVTASVEGGALA